MGSRAQQQREEDFLKDQDSFRSNAYKLIFEMAALIQEGDTTHLLDEMLHSIFFLGKVNEPTFSPEKIFEDEEILNELKEIFPRAFELFSSHLPRRSPFSCMVDVIVLQEKSEIEIISTLRNLIIALELGDSRELIPSTLCVSHRTDIDDPVKYYGVSMATPCGPKKGRFPRQFVIAACCLCYWDECVAAALLTYFPASRKPDYDGTIQLPQRVRCQAFSLSMARETPPCLSCSDVFGLRNNSQSTSVYGNCGEYESLSKLLKHERDVKEQVQRPPNYSDNKRDTFRRGLGNDLRNWLKDKTFTWRGDFYNPS
ncbi:uncharacterized protein AB9W97_001524 isoform 2-T5 [Spinachia spinachia]